MLMSKVYKSTGEVLKYCFEFIPHYTITYAFMRFSFLVLSNNECKLRKPYCKGSFGEKDLCCRKFVCYSSHRYQLVMLIVSMLCVYSL